MLTLLIVTIIILPILYWITLKFDAIANACEKRLQELDKMIITEETKSESEKTNHN